MSPMRGALRLAGRFDTSACPGILSWLAGGAFPRRFLLCCTALVALKSAPSEVLGMGFSRIRLVLALALVVCSCAIATVLLLRAGRILNTSVSAAPAAPDDARLKGAYRFDQSGWVYVHLEGDPGTVGFQHGSLLAPEIEDAFQSV